MGDFTTVSAETIELTEMERIFPSLLKKGYFTEIDFQKIKSIKKLADRQSEIYKLLMMKDESTAVEIFNIFRRMTSRVVSKHNGNHALLNTVVADCIFAFLPMSDVLKCRLVCQQWNTASSNNLRKRVTINFQKRRGPSKFDKAFKNSLADIRFKSFEFSNVQDEWDVLEIDKFFDKWGANIEMLKFHAHCLFKKNKEDWFKDYDITHWIEKACNLTKLDVRDYSCKEKTKIEVRLSKIASVKSISVHGCIISIKDALKENIQIKPMEISFQCVTFQSEGSIVNKIRLNDVIDFSQATEIKFVVFIETNLELDMSQIHNVKTLKSLHLNRLKLTNWEAASGKVDLFYLRSSNFVVRNQLQIEQMFCENCTVDLSALPKTMKKLHLPADVKYTCTEEINLPQLRYLRLDNHNDFPQMPYFNRCANLVELELLAGEWDDYIVNLKVNLIPKSVKRLKLNCNIIITKNDNDVQEIGGENDILNLDTLILEDYLHCFPSNECIPRMMSFIKPKVLVVSSCDGSDKDRRIDTTSICEFLLVNKQLDKLVVGSVVDDFHNKTPFESSVFARFVGRKKADYYVFENRHETGSEYEDPVGTPISIETFELYRQMNALDKHCHSPPDVYYSIIDHIM